jgi:hypothetical protein
VGAGMPLRSTWDVTSKWPPPLPLSSLAAKLLPLLRAPGVGAEVATWGGAEEAGKLGTAVAAAAAVAASAAADLLPPPLEEGVEEEEEGLSLELPLLPRRCICDAAACERRSTPASSARAWVGCGGALLPAAEAALVLTGGKV